MMNRFLRVFICSTILLIVFSSCFVKKVGVELSYPAWMKGKWRGVGLQLNFPQTWTMELNADNKMNFMIRYPTLDCSGVWKLKTASSSKAEFIEIITQGHDRCTNGGKIIITKIDQNHISFSYFSSNGGKLQAHSTLINTAFKESMKI